MVRRTRVTTVNVYFKFPFTEIGFKTSGFELAVRNSQFAMRFGSLGMSFCIFSKNCKLLKSDTLWIFRLIHWNSYILSYFKPIKYPLLNNNMIAQRFIVYINFKIHTSFFSSYHFVNLTNFKLVISFRD